MTVKKVLVLGLGNILLGDEGVGVRVVEQLLSLSLPEWVEVIDGGTAGYELINLFEGKERVIIVDAVKTDDVPGSVYKLDMTILDEDANVHLSLHQVGLKNVFRMASLMDINPEVTLIGIVPKEYQDCRIGLSKEVEKAIPMAIKAVYQELGIRQ